MKAIIVGTFDDGVIDCLDTRVYLGDDTESAYKWFDELLVRHLGAFVTTPILEDARHKGIARSLLASSVLVFCQSLNDVDVNGIVDVGDEDFSISLALNDDMNAGGIHEVTVVANVDMKAGKIKSIRAVRLPHDGERLFADEMKDRVSNFDDYTGKDIDDCLDDGRCKYGNNKYISICQVEVRT